MSLLKTIEIDVKLWNWRLKRYFKMIWENFIQGSSHEKKLIKYLSNCEWKKSVLARKKTFFINIKEIVFNVRVRL